MALFNRWNGISIPEFREAFGLTDKDKHTDTDVRKALRYGCERVDLESGNAILELIKDKKGPGDLTRDQQATVEESAVWCANHMLKQGLGWLRGSGSISMGSISTGQTNPDEPDYFPPFLRNKLVGAGLLKFIQTGNLQDEKSSSYDDLFNQDPEKVFPPTRDFLKKAYIAKKGDNSLVSRDGTIDVKPSGGVYDGVDLSIRQLLMERINYRGLTLMEEKKNGESYFTLTAEGTGGGGIGLPRDEIIHLIELKTTELVKKLAEKLRTDIQEGERGEHKEFEKEFVNGEEKTKEEFKKDFSKFQIVIREKVNKYLNTFKDEIAELERELKGTVEKGEEGIKEVLEELIIKKVKEEAERLGFKVKIGVRDYIEGLPDEKDPEHPKYLTLPPIKQKNHMVSMVLHERTTQFQSVPVNRPNDKPYFANYVGIRKYSDRYVLRHGYLVTPREQIPFFLTMYVYLNASYKGTQSTSSGDESNEYYGMREMVIRDGSYQNKIIDRVWETIPPLVKPYNLDERGDYGAGEWHNNQVRVLCDLDKFPLRLSAYDYSKGGETVFNSVITYDRRGPYRFTWARESNKTIYSFQMTRNSPLIIDDTPPFSVKFKQQEESIRLLEEKVNKLQSRVDLLLLGGDKQ